MSYCMFCDSDHEGENCSNPHIKTIIKQKEIIYSLTTERDQLAEKRLIEYNHNVDLVNTVRMLEIERDQLKAENEKMIQIMNDIIACGEITDDDDYINIERSVYDRVYAIDFTDRSEKSLRKMAGKEEIK